MAVTVAQRAKILDRLRAGETGRNIAKSIGVLQSDVSALRAEAGLPPGWIPMSKMGREKVDAFERLYRAGVPYKTMSAKLQMSTNSMSYWRDKLGLAHRHAERGERPALSMHFSLPQPIYARLTHEAEARTMAVGDLIRAKLAVPYRAD